jgi:DNA-directed RNA polymerase I and III subunit RPAC2
MSVNDIRNTITTELFEVKGGDSPKNATFIFGNEVRNCLLKLSDFDLMNVQDHTLGNSLRYVLMQRAETEFCGYSVPHPYEPKMNVRLQTNGSPAVSVLVEGLKDLETAADYIQDVFGEAMNNFAR